MRARTYRIVSCCAVCVCLSAACLAETTPAEGSTLMIVPARYRVLQLAFDMNWMKSVSIMSFRGDAKTAKPYLHLWTGSDWRHVGMEEFSSGLFMSPSPATVILVGDSKTVPASLVEAIAWDCKTARLETLDVGELVNRLNSLLHFNDEELALLARRYNLNLDDIYAKERAVNPYAIRRSELPLKAPAGEAVVMEEREVEGLILLEEVDR